MGNKLHSAEARSNNGKTSVLEADKSRLDQGEHEMEIAMGDDWEQDLHLHKERCRKNPQHIDFIQVNGFTKDHLPEGWRNDDIFKQVKDTSNKTVRLAVHHTSKNRPESLGFASLKGKTAVRMGTGWFLSEVTDIVLGKNQPCPFQNCPHSKLVHMVSPFFNIVTAAHVIFDGSEAMKTSVEFFYDDENDTSGVVKAEGVRVGNKDLGGDWCNLICVSHDLTLFAKLQQFESETNTKMLVKEFPDTQLVVMVSHPHGLSKHLTIGSLVDSQVVSEVDDDFIETFNRVSKQDNLTRLVSMARCTFEYTIPTCPGSSGAPVLILCQFGGIVSPCHAPHSCHKPETNVSRSGIGSVMKFEKNVEEETGKGDEFLLEH